MSSRSIDTEVLVVGGGASGAAVTWSLSKAGIQVTCLEQGDWLPFDAFPSTHPNSPTGKHPSIQTLICGSCRKIIQLMTPIPPYPH